MVNSEKTNEVIRAVGRRKSAVTRARITPGNGEIVVNGRPYKVYFPYFEWQDMVVCPLKEVGREDKLDVSAKILGGGLKGQAKSLQHAIARALVKYDEEFKKVLKAKGFLTRDARVKERKKPGLKKARRAPQWKKR